MPAAPGSAIVVLSARLGPVLPAAALPVLRDAAAVYTDGRACCGTFAGAAVAPSADKLAAQAAVEPVVLLTLDASGEAASALRGAMVIQTPEPAGAALIGAAAVMDRLRSPGGCPWDAEQTHASLRRYLVEETYELLDAIEHADRAALREELGDVLLQVLFHARIAAEDAAEPFDVDDVASSLVDKLVSRHPHVFALAELPSTAADQEVRWEELKRTEKRRGSSVDGVALGQPAVALVAKLASRTHRAGLPADLLPAAAGTGAALFAAATRASLAGEDPEAELRAVALRFAGDVRAAEDAARAVGLDPAALDADAWRRFFPRRTN
jgi:XTP/dITP diphosphohydrolase